MSPEEKKGRNAELIIQSRQKVPQTWAHHPIKHPIRLSWYNHDGNANTHENMMTLINSTKSGEISAYKMDPDYNAQNLNMTRKRVVNDRLQPK